MERSQGAELALLLLRGFRSMVDDVTRELANRGHASVRPADEFALRAVDGGADTASELARRLSISKQAAAQRIAILQQLGYVDRAVDPTDARRKRLQVTPRGYEMMRIGGVLLNDMRNRWAAEIGPSELEALEAHLARLTAGTAFPADDVRD
jgi:DNA-binding MarR family transcriptional regulator